MARACRKFHCLYSWGLFNSLPNSKKTWDGALTFNRVSRVPIHYLHRSPLIHYLSESTWFLLASLWTDSWRLLSQAWVWGSLLRLRTLGPRASPSKAPTHSPLWGPPTSLDAPSRLAWVPAVYMVPPDMPFLVWGISFSIFGALLHLSLIYSPSLFLLWEDSCTTLSRSQIYILLNHLPY